MRNQWKYTGLIAIAAMALAACSTEPEEPEAARPMNLDEAAEEFGKLDQPEPGQYKLEVEVTRFDLPGAPDNMLDQMKGMMESAYADSFCLTAEDAAKGFKEQLGQVAQDGQCDFNRLSVDGGKLDAKALCALDGGTMEMTMNGTVGKTGSDVVADAKMTAQGQEMTMTMRMKQTRTGDCAA
ncbi:DUF3617 domain-containing protein [Croceicoccus sp. Ery15]|uniref:DUF3617 domain-containing protein n=1 Tax=Croceicoccus sp. Ery15 TaxID=1703338 RepID=UPI001E41FD10|nr:DUF3617 domain-containing protein [Croceicoccus sp. Ery15]